MACGFYLRERGFEPSGFETVKGSLDPEASLPDCFVALSAGVFSLLSDDAPSVFSFSDFSVFPEDDLRA
jgi:hypothetical protein